MGRGVWRKIKDWSRVWFSTRKPGIWKGRGKGWLPTRQPRIWEWGGEKVSSFDWFKSSCLCGGSD